ncbi:DUF2975 domain-containing protein [Sinomicrobium sp. M5D2P17]
MKTNQILKSMKVVSWIIFIGICIKAGAILISFIVSLLVYQEAAKDLYLGLDLTDIHNFSPGVYVAFVVFMLFLLAVQAFIFFLVIKLFSKFEEQMPFSQNVSELISKISYFSLLVGCIALIGTGFSKWLESQNVSLDFDWSAEEFLFMAGVIFIIGLFYKRGVEIQSENELTI